MSRTLASFLLRIGAVPQTTLEMYQSRAEKDGRHLLGLLSEAGLINEADLAQRMAVAHQMQFIQQLPQRIPLDVLNLIPAAIAIRRLVLPVEANNPEGTLIVAVVDPTDTALQDELCFRTGMQISMQVAELTNLEAAIHRLYTGERAPTPGTGDSPAPASAARSATGRNIDIGDLFGPSPKPRAEPTLPTAPARTSSSLTASGEGTGTARLRVPRAFTRSEEGRSFPPERRSLADQAERTMSPRDSVAMPGLRSDAVVGMQTMTDLSAQLPPRPPAEESRPRSPSQVTMIDLIKQLLTRLLELENKVGEISRGQQDLVELLIKDGLLSRKAYLEWLNNRSRT